MSWFDTSHVPQSAVGALPACFDFQHVLVVAAHGAFLLIARFGLVLVCLGVCFAIFFDVGSHDSSFGRVVAFCHYCLPPSLCSAKENLLSMRLTKSRSSPWGRLLLMYSKPILRMDISFLVN